MTMYLYETDMGQLGGAKVLTKGDIPRSLVATLLIERVFKLSTKDDFKLFANQFLLYI